MGKGNRESRTEGRGSSAVLLRLAQRQVDVQRRAVFLRLRQLGGTLDIKQQENGMALDVHLPLGEPQRRR